MSDAIQTHQLFLLICCFLLGCLGTLFLFRLPRNARPWRIADLVWVLLGGLGALAALAAGIYSADSSRLERQIGIALTSSRSFDQDAARFRLLYCQSPENAAVDLLCQKVEFLSASTAENSALPLFISVTERAAPLQGLHFFLGPRADSMTDMKEASEALDNAEFLTFNPMDETTVEALVSARISSPRVAGEYQVLGVAYGDLIEQVERLKNEWDYLRANAHILAIQVIALCLVAFAAPFRLGRSLKELM